MKKRSMNQNYTYYINKSTRKKVDEQKNFYP